MGSTDDAKLFDALLHHPARIVRAAEVARQAGVDEEYAREALQRMASLDEVGRPTHRITAHRGLGPDLYEVIRTRGS